MPSRSQRPEPDGEERAKKPMLILFRSKLREIEFHHDPSNVISQGSSWLHVGTDQPFKSISIGGANQVWAIAKDGAVFYRGSVSQLNPAGQLEVAPSPISSCLTTFNIQSRSI